MMQWKRDFVELAEHIKSVIDRIEPDSRVAALIRQYGEVTQALLNAEVNGGLDECYMDFPDAPKMEGCLNTERCYCDLLEARDNFIVKHGLWGEFLASQPSLNDRQ